MRTLKRTGLMFVGFLKKIYFFEYVRRHIVEYCIGHSVVSSNRRDTIHMKEEETCMKIEHPKHFVDMTQCELLEAFKK